MARHSSVKWITCKSCNHEYSKQYSYDVTGIEIIFKSDISNQTLASKIFS